MATALLLAACNDSDNDYPHQAAFVTTHLIGAEPAASGTGRALPAADYYFTGDAGTRLYPADRSRVPGYQPEEGERLIISFNLMESKTAGYDHDIALYGIGRVKIGGTATAATEAEAASYGTAHTSIGSVAETSRDWFNMRVGYSGTDEEKHRFTLVRNLSPETAAAAAAYYPDLSQVDRNDPDYLFLELRHDAAGDPSGIELTEWISVPLDGFATELEGKKGLIVAVPTRANGIRCIYYHFPEAQ